MYEITLFEYRANSLSSTVKSASDSRRYSTKNTIFSLFWISSTSLSSTFTGSSLWKSILSASSVSSSMTRRWASARVSSAVTDHSPALAPSGSSRGGGWGSPGPSSLLRSPCVSLYLAKNSSTSGKSL